MSCSTPPPGSPEIDFKLQYLRAKVSLRAEVLDLVKRNVGAEAHPGEVELNIKGVEAQALLKVRLDHVAAILGPGSDDDRPQPSTSLQRGPRGAGRRGARSFDARVGKSLPDDLSSGTSHGSFELGESIELWLGDEDGGLERSP